MIKGIGHVWHNHWRGHIWLYLLVLLSLIIGVVIGTASVKLLTMEETRELEDYLSIFIGGLEHFNWDQLQVIRQFLYNNFKTLGLIWFLGLTVLGAPLILILLMAEGFTLGFTVGFLVQEKGLQGILLSLTALTPSNIFLLPALLTAGVVGITFSYWLIKGRFQRQNGGISQQFLSYTFSMVILGIIITISGILEAYCAPLLMRLVVAYFS